MLVQHADKSCASTYDVFTCVFDFGREVHMSNTQILVGTTEYPYQVSKHIEPRKSRSQSNVNALLRQDCDLDYLIFKTHSAVSFKSQICRSDYCGGGIFNKSRSKLPVLLVFTCNFRHLRDNLNDIKGLSFSVVCQFSSFPDWYLFLSFCMNTQDVFCLNAKRTCSFSTWISTQAISKIAIKYGTLDITKSFIWMFVLP